MTLHESRTTEGRGRLYESVVDTIGDTPCIRINRIAPKHVRLYVKAESFNPAASARRGRPAASSCALLRYREVTSRRARAVRAPPAA